MKNADVIAKLPTFQRLINLRRKIVWVLSIVLSITLLVNILLMSAWSEFGARSITSDSNTSIAIAYSVLVIFFGVACCIFYVWLANRKLDKLVDEVRSSAEQGDV